MNNKHLDFEEKYSPSGKTKIIRVYNKYEEFLGEIKWRGGWRQYIWQQDSMIDMSWDCLVEVIEKIKDLMSERKNKSSDSLMKSEQKGGK